MEPRVSPPRATVADYLAAEAEAETRHEYDDGSIYAMSGGTEEHSLIISNVIGEARNPLKGKGLRVYDSNLRIRVESMNRFYYPDAFVVHGETQYAADDRRHSSVMNPRATFEVLSDSTQGGDRLVKFSHFATLPSLRAYVLVSQHEPNVQVCHRQEDDTWRMTFDHGLEAVAKLTTLDVELPLAEVYADVMFEEQVSQQV